MNKIKTIWIVNQTAGNLESGWGERHFFLSKHWVKKGYKVIIISGSYNHLFLKQPKISNKWFTVESVDKGIDFCWVKTPKYSGTGFMKIISNFVFTFKLFFLGTKILTKPDVVIVSSMPIFPILNGVFFKYKFKVKKLIFEIRDLWPLTPMHLKGYSKYHPFIIFLSFFEKYAYNKAGEIVSLLPNTKDYINTITKSNKEVHYIPNGIDVNLISNDNISEETINLIPKNKFIIGYAGTIGLANAMEFFVEASKLVTNDDIHFLIVGDGYLKEKLKRSVTNSSNITFIDKISKSKVQNLLSYFDVCYLGRYKSPLYHYGVSYNKYFDYMLAKKPILESSEYIKDQVELSNCGIIVPPESPKDIVNGILKLYDMKEEKRIEMGEKGYVFVKKYHSYLYLSNLYEKIF
ncbi:glycosyltransferase family 4 protein [Polaribacter aestuariivivens]|uniref:Glycosyltransferase family 4 protein n=1 Tax=Polaribacter aestuariivivens TaxID=2304626 RepID=A0A5S3N9X9_9FLAO|nr:glycosyltransferase family 4 protein [Polaribacter aestuariivivens]TMM31334.1 glycosyltransferase family 4 protein [Polaribacter aestuariivivens]